MKKHRIIFMGTPEFAVPSLQSLLEANQEVVAVYSQPPRPAGRGYKVTPSPVHAFAESQGIPVLTPTSLKSPEVQAEFAAFKPDLAVVTAYGLLLPQAVLDIPSLGCVNVHGSLLPRWRGAAPIQRAIMAGDDKTGITIMQMEAGLDTGPMWLLEQVPITASTTTTELHDQLAMLGGKLLKQFLREYASLQPVVQPEEGITYAKKLSREESRINWSEAALTLDHSVRALTPWPGMWFDYQGEKIKVHQIELVKVNSPQGKPGIVMDNRLEVACGVGSVRPLVLQRPGGKSLNVDDFLRGHPISAGTQL